MNSTELDAKSRELAACRTVSSCEQGVKSRYDKLTSDRTETALTSINAMKAYDLCGSRDTACQASSLVQMQSLLADLKSTGLTADNVERMGLTAHIASAQSALGLGTDFLNSAGAVAIGASASNAGNSGANGVGTGQLTGARTVINSGDDAATIRSLMRENESATTLANNGYRVQQNPPALPNGKNPDYIVNGQVFDNYAPSTSSARNAASEIQGKVTKGQTENVVVNLADTTITPAQLQAQLTSYPILGLKQVVVIDQAGKIVVIKVPH